MKVYYNGIGCAFAGFYGKYGASAENIIGFGGIPDNEKTRAFLKLHKEVTGIDSRTTMPAPITTRTVRFSDKHSRALALWIGMRSPST